MRISAIRTAYTLNEVTGVDVPTEDVDRVLEALQWIFDLQWIFPPTATVQCVKDWYGEDALPKVTKALLQGEGWWAVLDALLVLIDWPAELVYGQLESMCRNHVMWKTPMFNSLDTDSVLAPLLDRTKRTPNHKPSEIGRHVLFHDVRKDLIRIGSDVGSEYKALNTRLDLLVIILDALKMAYSKPA